MTYRSLTRATQPVVEPVTLTEAKGHLRVDTDDDNSYIMGLVAAARGWVEEYLDRSLVHTQWTMRMDEFPPNGMEKIELPRPPMATRELRLSPPLQSEMRQSLSLPRRKRMPCSSTTVLEPGLTPSQGAWDEEADLGAQPRAP